ncbi:hypothetical protein HDA40_008126 [Hamadaea flava]|uniref:Uncharacterized protein n=1 Tax=Hamadaea flava TaxID=1742688 RepID=A0ABV8LMT4_9ACTN|nr:hypothetical protein [Hamadaea flava]MCP2329619.1 hypothetical protein [Hamadaea flava]
MGYFVSIVLTRSSTRLTALPSIERIGYRHVRLRELGGGWQVLETQGVDDPPELEDAVAHLSQLWNEPVLAAYVSDDWCAQAHWATPTRPVSSVHLPRPQQLPDCGFLHRPDFTASRAPAEVADDIAGWAYAAGLTVARPRLDAVVAYRDDVAADEGDEVTHMFAGDQIFELIRALGFTDIPPAVPKTFDPYARPFCAITAIGLAHTARLNATLREDGRTDLTGPEQPWEQAAIVLDEEVFAAAYADDCDLDDLVSRALSIISAKESPLDPSAPPIEVSADRIESTIAELRRGPAWSPPEPFVGTGGWPDLSADRERS